MVSNYYFLIYLTKNESFQYINDEDRYDHSSLESKKHQSG